MDFFYNVSINRKKKIIYQKINSNNFDDGYEDNFTNAFPILKKYNAKATIYIVVDRHDREWSSKKKREK